VDGVSGGAASGVRPPAGRYGAGPGRGRRTAALIALGLVGAVALAWLLWVALHWASPPVRSSLVGYTVTSDRAVTIKFEIVKDTGHEATCRIRARNQAGEEVGGRVVTIPAATRDAVVSEVLQTRERAVTGEVKECRLSR
jgi:hypothetical protein